MWQSRTLWLAGLTALALGSGCVVEDTDDSAFRVAWQVSFAAGGGPATCEDAGTPTVRLTAKNVRTGAEYVGDFPCSAGAGISDVLPLGDYLVWMSLLDRPERGSRVVSQLDVSAYVGGPLPIRRHGLTDLPVIGFEAQTFEVTWILLRAGPGGTQRSVTCAEAGASTVQLEARLASENAELFNFPCAQGEGFTEAIRVGNYAAQVRLLNAAGQVVSETDAMPFNVRPDQPALIEVDFAVP